MFNSNNGYSLSDIAAATGGNNGNRNCDDMWGGNGAWWIYGQEIIDITNKIFTRMKE